MEVCGVAIAGKDRLFVVKQELPLNGGVPAGPLAMHHITPTKFFFVRNHAPVPYIDPAAFRLTVSGLVDRPRIFSLNELAREFTVSTVEAALECAGNRRTELAAVRPIPGELPWETEAVGNARWAGVALADVLDACGVGPGARHVSFTAADRVNRDGVTFGFGGSIPLEKAASREVLLAFAMNDEPLRPEHGAPLRVVVPGYIGARSVKWVTEVSVGDAPSENYFQQRAYRFTADESAAGTMLGEYAVNAAITMPLDGAVLAVGRASIRGYALSGSGEIEKVEVSVDGGQTWLEAMLSPPMSPWAWRLWTVEANLPAGDHELCVRARDTTGNVQPDDPRRVWNVKGYVNNSWHRVRVLNR